MLVPMALSSEHAPLALFRWRVAVTRDEGPDGPLGRALLEADFEPGLCPARYLTTLRTRAGFSR